MTLNSPAITELTSQSAPLNLLIEWLRGFFNGQMQTVGSNAPVTFPNAQIVAGQAPTKQPLDGTEIRIVLLPRRETSEPLNTSLYNGNLVTSYVMLHFTVSSKIPGKDGSNSKQASQNAGELLKAILTNPTTRYPLCENGFRAFAPVAVHEIPSADFHKHLVMCGCQLMYPVEFGPAVAFPSDELSLAFTEPDPLVVGDYLLGQYVWNQRSVTLLSVNAAYLPSTGEDVVLGLEIAGVQSGFTLTLPQGDPDTAATVSSTAINIALSPGQLVRWQVLSGPIPELTAWQVTLNVQAK